MHNLTLSGYKLAEGRTNTDSIFAQWFINAVLHSVQTDNMGYFGWTRPRGGTLDQSCDINNLKKSWNCALGFVKIHKPSITIIWYIDPSLQNAELTCHPPGAREGSVP